MGNRQALWKKKGGKSFKLTLLVNDKDEYAWRLNKVAREIAKKQMLSLENAGDEFSRTVVFDRFRQNPEGFPLPDGTITIEGIERDFRIVVLEVDAGAKK